MSPTPTRLADTPIAIVGLSALFPRSGNLTQFWGNVIEARDCIEPVPPTHWDVADYYDPDPTVPDKTYSNRGGFVPPTDFSPLEFGLPPNTLEVTDVLQLLSLVLARDVLADAGAPGATWYDPRRTGVVLGITGANSLTQPLATRLQTPVMKRVMRSCGLSEQDAKHIADTFVTAYAPWEENSFPGMLGNVVAGRIANRLDLGGMNCTVDAACASSLAAVRMAVDELVLGRSDLMITGGCDAENTILMYLCFSKTPAFSKTGVIRPFDVEADGTLIGEGIGMLAMKRLADAERDGDRIYAVVRGLGTSSDGRYKSIYAPRAQGQRLALTRAYADAAVSPADIGLIEAHGTGTAVGDQTELEALGEVYRDATEETRFAAVGSVKSQIGHTKAAAGAAGMIKLALALHHQVLPPTINVTTPNSTLAAPNTPFLVNVAARPWLLEPARPQRLAALSAFGFGGTNFHAVLAEHRPTGTGHRAPGHPTARVLAWHAADPAALRALLAGGAEPGDGPVPAGDARVAFVATDADSVEQARSIATARLEQDPAAASWAHPHGIHYRHAAAPGRVAAVFAGQGSQYLDMGRTALLAVPPLRAAFEAANAQGVGDATPLSRLVFASAFGHGVTEADARLRDTSVAQPAIAALATGHYTYLRELGFAAEGFLGHSFGELVALWAAGSISDREVHALARARGQAMAQASAGGDPGAMAALAVDVEAARELIKPFGTVVVCNDNAPAEVVVGGATADIEALVAACTQAGTTARRLPVSAAFHTPFVSRARDAFRAALQVVPFPAPRGAVYPCTPGAQYGPDPAANRSVLAEQLAEPVAFRDQVQRMHADGFGIFVEFGPKGVLTKMIGRCLPGADIVTVSLDGGPSKDADRHLKGALAALVAAGLPLRDVNRYWTAPPAPQPTKGMTIPLLGVNHVPAKRRDAFASALASGYQVEGAEQASTRSAAVLAAATLGADGETTPPGVSSGGPHLQVAHRLLGLLQETSSRPGAAAEPGPHLTGGAAAGPVAVNVTAPAAVGGPGTHGAVAVLTAPVTTTTGGPGSGSGGASTALAAAVSAKLLEIVAEQTGYAADMLDLSMTVEADLGIDSIKRVQVLGALRDAFPQAPTISADEVGEIQTLEDIVTLVAGALGDTAFEAPPEVPAVPVQATRSSTPVVVAPVVTAPVAVQAPSGGVTVAVREKLLEIVAEQTGYAADMLDPSMTVETDLGIDSIKRVQILGALRDAFPQAPTISADEVGEIQTLEDIVTLVAGTLGDTAVGSPPEVPAVPAQATPASAPVVAVPVAVAAPSAGVTVAVREKLLEIVAEQTGYAADMLDPSMTVETDLGIDSIKRVQILGALRDAFPQAPTISADEVGEIQTLEDIVTLVAGTLGDTAVGSPPEVPAVPAPAAPILAAPVTPPVAVAAPSAGVTVAVREKLLEIVAEQTGYAADMLDPSMTVETDLGIDSIKRVQILGALRDAFPQAPTISADEVGEIQTLEDIVTLVAGSLGDTAVGTPPEVPAVPAPAAPVVNVPVVNVPVVITPATSPAAVQAPSGGVTVAVREKLLEIVAEQTGYAADMLDPSMTVETDLGIDSIKRVQILGALRDAFPQAPTISADEVGEIQTLEDIVTLVAGSLGDTAIAAPPAVETPAAPVPAAVVTARATAEGIVRTRLELRELPSPDRLLLPTGGVAVVVDDGRNGLALAYGLQRSGWRVHLLTVPGAPAVAGGHALADWSQAEVTARIEQIAAAEGRLHLLAYLAGTRVAELPQAQERLVHALCAARAGLAGLEAGAAEGRSLFLTVTALDGAFGTRTPVGPADAALGGLSGLVKTLAVESPAVSARHVDLAPGLQPLQVAEGLLAEVEDPARDVREVGRDADARVTWALVPHPGSTERTPALGGDDVLVITGGARGVTAACAVELARRYRSTLLLLGRTRLQDDPAWASAVEDTGLKAAAVAHARAEGQTPKPRDIERTVRSVLAAREIRRTLEAIRSAGGGAEYLATDVADGAAVAAALEPYQGRITGVVHGAGVLHDALVSKAEAAPAAEVLQVKLSGLASVLSAAESPALRHVLLFTSVAGLSGNRGQAAYAMANEALNRLAVAVRGAHPERHVTAVNWGAWAGGMVSPELAEMFAQRGVTLIPVPAGSAFLAEQFETGHHDDVVVAVGPATPLAGDGPRPPAAAVTSRVTLAGLVAHPAVRDHVIAGHPVLPLSFALGGLVGAAEQAAGAPVRLVRGVRVHKGVIFDGAAPVALDLTLTPAEGELRGTAHAVLADGTQRPGYAGTLSWTGPEAGPSRRFGGAVEPAQELYDGGVLFHGARLQGIAGLLDGEPGELAVRCRLADLPVTGRWSGAAYSPVLFDLLLQAGLVWVRAQTGSPSLPMGIAEVELHAPLPDDMEFTVAVRGTQVDASRVSCEITAYGPDGAVLQRLRGVDLVLKPDLGGDRPAA